MELIRRATAPQRLVEPSLVETFDVLAGALTRKKAQLFPTKRRPKRQALSNASPDTTESWFLTSGISIGDTLTSSQRA